VSPEPDRREALARATASRAQRDRDLGRLLIWLGVAIFAIALLGLVGLSRAGLLTHDLVGELILLPAWGVAVLVVRRGLRMRASAGDRVLGDDDRAPIVYLRSFTADGTVLENPLSSRVRSSLWARYITQEERLERTLRKVGPFVAVGDPTESLPRLGAARVYASDEEWRTAVDELTAGAAVVLLQTGESDGLAWEVQHVVGLDSPERVILALPPPGGRKQRQRRYGAFHHRFAGSFPRGLPEAIGDCQFIYFDPDWTPRLLEGRAALLPSGDAPCEAAVRRLGREFKVKWAPRWVRIAAVVTAIFGVSALVQLITGDLQSGLRVGDCASDRVAQLKVLKPPFAATDATMRDYVAGECHALEDRKLLADGKRSTPAAARVRCERYTRALYDYEPTDRRGARSLWSRVATVYCDTPGTPLLRTAAEVNGG
jgi:hypothetical protein